jgi:hypothetical protein
VLTDLKGMFGMGPDSSKHGAHYFVDIALSQGEFIYEISCFYVAGVYGSITLHTNVGSYTVNGLGPRPVVLPSCSLRPCRFLRNMRPAKRTNWLNACQVGSRETGTHHKIQILRQDLFDLVAFAGICPRLFLISTWNPDTLGRILAWGSSYLPFI